MRLVPAAGVVVVGSVVLVGWLVDDTALKDLSPAFAQMKAITAFAFVLAGTSLLLLQAGRSRLLGQALAALVTLIGLLALCEYIFGVDLGIDHFPLPDSGQAVANPTPRMGANTAFDFAVVGISLLTLEVRRHGTPPAQVGAAIVALVALVSVLGYALDVPRAESGFINQNIEPMALHTALGFILIAVGLLAARPGLGVLRLGLSPGAGGRMVRRLFLPALLAPVLIGYLTLLGRRAGLYGAEEDTVLFALVLIVVFGALIWVTARALELSDADRQESRARESAVLESALDCILTIDEQGRILDFNGAAERTFGFERNDVVGKPMAELIVPPSLRARHYEGFARHLATGEITILDRRLELTAMRADGSEFPVELSITRGELSGQPFFTGYLRDLSEQKQAEQERVTLEAQVRQGQKMEAIGRVSAGIAHDFNNFLTAIALQSQVLERDAEPGTPLLRGLEQIKLTTEKATSLTRQLMTFSRHDLNPRVLDLNAVITDVFPMIERIVGDDVEFALLLEPGLKHVRVDPGQIDQVIVNLAVNAADAMPGGGRLRVATSNVQLGQTDIERNALISIAPGPYVVLSASDTGVGMDEDTQSRIFEPFFTTKDLEKGTGLGLSTVYGIVTQSQGAIRVYSEQGRGATFEVYLPALEHVDPAAPSPRDDDETPTRGPETALLVEDSAA